ncbi:MAG: aminodeoxychorismate synthase component I, partial [Moraxellaceae bacterium]
MPKPVQLIPITYYPNSADWFVQIRQLTMPVWLDSCHPHSSYGRFDIISAAPALILNTYGDTTLIHENDDIKRSLENPFSLLKRYLPQNQPHFDQVPFCGGVLGYFGYDLGRRLEKLPALAMQDINLPDMSVGVYPWAIIQDHHKKLSW